jgi:hypothetical protein
VQVKENRKFLLERNKRELVFGLEGPDLGWLVAFCGDADIEAVALGVAVAGANADRGGDIGDQFVVVRLPPTR